MRGPLTTINKKFNKTLLNEPYDIIIIGSGISGLCCAALLALKGKKVLVLEKHFKIGGYTHTFKRKGYEWDVGIHYVGDMHKEYNPARKIFDLITGENLHWSKMHDNYDSIIFPDKKYDLYCPKELFVENMIKWFPKEEEPIMRYMALLKEVAQKSKNYYMAKVLPKLFSTLLTPLLSRPYFKLSDKTTYDVITSLSSDTKLLGVLTGQWGDYGLPPKRSSFVMHAGVVQHYLDGGNYPAGGSGQIAANIVPVIRNNGGEIFNSMGVEKIIMHKNTAIGVRLENGEEIYAPKIISSAGVMNTYERLLKSNALPKIRQSLTNVRKTEGHLCLYIGLNGSAKELGLRTTNYWIYPSYDHDKNVENFVTDQTKQFPVLYLSFPSVKDPNWQKDHPHQSTMEAITLAHYDWFEAWKDHPWKSRGNEYEEIKEKYAQRMLEMIYKTLPQLKGKIDYYELSTPLSTKSMVNYQSGELYGLEHTPKRFRQDWLRPKSPIKGLFLTGQDVTTVGLTGALFSGVLTSSVILRKNLFKEIIKS